MARGNPTDDAVIEEFRARYLYSGNASKCAREMELPESTGRDLAQRISEEPSFVESRRKLRAQALDELVAMRKRVAEIAAERFEDDLPMPEKVGEGATVTIIDKRPDYAKIVLDAEKNAHNLARFDAERDGTVQAPGAVTINVSPTPEAAQRMADEKSG